MGKRVAILQSNYVPWKGYLDLINLVDEVILLDDVQYTRQDWRNRNRIKTPQGLQWLTIPVHFKFKNHQKIKDTQVDGHAWAKAHWKALRQNYTKAPYFADYAQQLERVYLQCKETYLSAVNHRFLTEICEMLGIGTKITWSMDYTLAEGKTERLVDLCRQAGADVYLSGPAARDYVEEGLFEQAGIRLEYMDYSGYPEYEQLYGPFEHGVTVLDLLFHTGPEAPRYMKSF